MNIRRIIHDKLYRTILIKKIKNLKIELFSNNYILVASSIDPFFKNWGDDISTIIAELINPKIKVIPSKYSFNIRKKKEILCVGSIITWLTRPNSTIWGSGVQFPQDEILFDNKIVKPEKVCAVRGPLTRQYLIERNIECPEIYGDPALLFPLFYSPKVTKKYKIGVIPHFKDKNSPKVKELLQKNYFHFIDIQDSSDWRKLINEIASCEFIITSTLHGLIISDSYNVPNIWVEFDKVNLKRFTFLDYFASVEKNVTEPVNINELNSYESIIKYTNQWQKPKIDLQKLLDSCPFKNKLNDS